MQVDHTIVDDATQHAPSLIPVAASVLPFAHLFKELVLEEDEEGNDVVSWEMAVPYPGMQTLAWCGYLYPDRAVVQRVSGGRIHNEETMSLRTFWDILRRADRSTAVTGKRADQAT